MRSRVAPLVWLLAAASGGCVAPNAPTATPPQAVDEVDAISVLSQPTASDWDGRGGPDGLSVSVHLWQSGRDLPVTARGRLEFVLYEGVIHAGDLPAAKPFERWTFPGPSLPRHLGRSIAGWGYAFRLPWSRPPTTSAVTLTARYVSPKGRPVPAQQPTVIAVGGG